MKMGWKMLEGKANMQHHYQGDAKCTETKVRMVLRTQRGQPPERVLIRSCRDFQIQTDKQLTANQSDILVVDKSRRALL